MSTKAQPVKDVDCDNWCRTVSANTAKSTFMWTIENFNARPEERNDSLPSAFSPNTKDDTADNNNSNDQVVDETDVEISSTM